MMFFFLTILRIYKMSSQHRWMVFSYLWLIARNWHVHLSLNYHEGSPNARSDLVLLFLLTFYFKPDIHSFRLNMLLIFLLNVRICFLKNLVIISEMIGLICWIWFVCLVLVNIICFNILIQTLCWNLRH